MTILEPIVSDNRAKHVKEVNCSMSRCDRRATQRISKYVVTFRMLRMLD